MSKITVIITAGGSGSRYGTNNKLLETVKGKTVLEYTVEKFLEIKEISEIIISANISIIETVKKLFDGKDKIKIVEGGKTRQQSVYNALKAAESPDYVLIHDGARPLVKVEDIKKVIEKTIEKGASILAVKTVDTIKKVDDKGKILETVERTNLYNVQTPQGFKYRLIMNAHKTFEGENFTDDAGMIEKLGEAVYVVEGSYDNFKITTKDDFLRFKQKI